MMKERNTVFFGLTLGLILFLLDRWLDSHNHSLRISWLLVIFGGVIGSLTKRYLMSSEKEKNL